MLSDAERGFIETCRTATLATIAPDGTARMVPVCFALGRAGEDGAPALYTPLDDKPKQSADPTRLARVRDLVERPRVTLLFDRWDEDWSHLAWLRVHGTAALLERARAPDEHAATVAALRARYPQYRRHAIDARPLIRVLVERTSAWGSLAGP